MTSDLSILCRAPAAAVIAFTEGLLPRLEPIEVLENRTGLAMLPLRDSAQGTMFFVGEALLAEARVRAAGSEGYAAVLGRNLVQALAVALLDAALRGGVAVPEIRAFVNEHATAQAVEDAALRANVASTRVEMETF